MNICQPHKEAYLKSVKVNFQHYSSIPGAQICRGKELRDGHLNFHQRDSEYLLRFELEPQKYQLQPLSALLTLHATSLLSDIFTIPPIKMLAPSVASFKPRGRHHRDAAIMLDGTSLYPSCHYIATLSPVRLFPGND